MTEQRCPAMKFCFFSSPFALFRRLSLVPSPVYALTGHLCIGCCLYQLHTYTHISYTLIRLYTFGEARNLNLQQKKNGIKWIFFVLFSEYFWLRWTRCAGQWGAWGECGVSGQLQQCTGCGFGNVRGLHASMYLAGQQRGRQGGSSCGRFGIWGQAYNQHNSGNNAH